MMDDMAVLAKRMNLHIDNVNSVELKLDILFG